MMKLMATSVGRAIAVRRPMNQSISLPSRLAGRNHEAESRRKRTRPEVPAAQHAAGPSGLTVLRSGQDDQSRAHSSTFHNSASHGLSLYPVSELAAAETLPRWISGMIE